MAKKTEEEKRREKIEAAWKTLTEAERKKLEAYAAHRGMSLDDYLDEQVSRAEDTTARRPRYCGDRPARRALPLQMT